MFISNKIPLGDTLVYTMPSRVKTLNCIFWKEERGDLEGGWKAEREEGRT